MYTSAEHERNSVTADVMKGTKSIASSLGILCLMIAGIHGLVIPASPEQAASTNLVHSGGNSGEEMHAEVQCQGPFCDYVIPKADSTNAEELHVETQCQGPFCDYVIPKADSTNAEDLHAETQCQGPFCDYVIPKADSTNAEDLHAERQCQGPLCDSNAEELHVETQCQGPLCDSNAEELHAETQCQGPFCDSVIPRADSTNALDETADETKDAAGTTEDPISQAPMHASAEDKLMVHDETGCQGPHCDFVVRNKKAINSADNGTVDAADIGTLESKHNPDLAAETNQSENNVGAKDAPARSEDLA
ncbi:hypothetical protein DACRYDRAFT_109979 [Dacryopinax primogenitus]|uniref:Uncharacterized protein n=1 Tax=Dacryopinax primogenitus (strain DJM 731) TaxID=1858805 RepID=M5FTA4_DACPD|nr:uncharacterized protein DACRYDRAFT_109979 [Dacryopinax primogenitus]EJT99258.1 hypothetical protein DACRYDRAFT_109979 [Dacryopinax primogenitus]